MDLPVNRFKRGLAAGEVQLGLWSMLAAPLAMEAASHVGFDFLVLDMEHQPADLPQIVQLMQAVGCGAASAIVRPIWNDVVQVKRVLDAGAQTLLMPFVQDRAEAERAVAATRYPAAGVRGVAGGQRANRFGLVADYAARAHEEICVICQIETPTALANLEEIAAVEGVDALFVGPADLSAAMGLLGQSGHPAVLAAMADAVARAHRAGKPIGVIGGGAGADIARRNVEMGFDFVAVASDQSLLVEAMQAALTRARG